MTHWIKILLLFFCCLSISVTAQRYPVAVTVTAPVSAPSTVQSLGMDPGGLMISLTLLDAAEISAQVRLRFTISSDRIGLISKESFFGGPITLEYNVPLLLTGMDLAPLLRPENFTVQGYPEDEFLRQGGTLPEGLYSVCVEVVDFRRSDAILSNLTCGMSWLDELAAPQITGPYDNEIITLLDPAVVQPVTLQWQIDPGAVVQPIGYNLYLYEYNEQNTVFGIGPAFYNQRPFFEQAIMATTSLDVSYIYGINGERDLLEPGKKYLLRVQAVSQNMNQFFRNDGFSDPIIFQYGEIPEPVDPEDLVCNAPEIENILAQDDIYDINWLSTGAEYYSILFYDPDKNLLDSIRTDNLAYQFAIPDVSLRYSGVVIGHCNDTLQAESLPFAIGNFNIQNPVAFDCGSGDAPFPIENRTDIDQLKVGDEIVAGDFNVLIDQLSTGGSTYSGVGTMVWNFPLQNFLKDEKKPIAVNIEFENISVNTDYQMYDGMMNITGLGISLIPPELAEFLDAFADEDIVSTEFSNTIGLIEVDFNISDASNIYVSPSNGTITITDPDGNNETFKWDGEDTEIVDGNGDVFIVDENGNVIDGGSIADSGKPTQDNTDGIDANSNVSELAKLGVVFKEDPAARFDFDTVATSAHASIKALYRPYPIRTPASIHHTSYKAVLQEQEDVLIAEIIDPSINVSNLEFKTMSGRQVVHTGTGNQLSLTVKGLFTSAEDKIIASHDLGNGQYEVVGVFHLTHLSGDRNANVVLVPLSEGASLDLSVQATDIFGPIGVNLNFTTESPIAIPDALLGDDGLLDCGGSGFFSNYTQEQQALIDHVKTTLGDRYREDAYYLFHGGPSPSRPLGGFMPLNRQFGFVFSGTGSEENKDNPSLTALHEIGHGVFAMEHPWSRYGVDENATTDWLMDYGGGDQLTHFYWKQVYDPALRLYVFQEDDEGASEKDPTYFCLQSETLLGYRNRCFQTPDDQLISLEGYDITQISFYAKEDDKSSIHGKLASFVANEVTYVATLPNGKFGGYKQYNGDKVFTINKGNCSTAEIVLGSIDDCLYSLNGQAQPQKAAGCNCNYPKEDPDKALFQDRFTSLDKNQDYDDILAKTKDLKEANFENDLSEIINSLCGNDDQILVTDFIISKELEQFNIMMSDRLALIKKEIGIDVRFIIKKFNYGFDEEDGKSVIERLLTCSNISENTTLVFIPVYEDKGFVDGVSTGADASLFYGRLFTHDPNNYTYDIPRDKFSSIISGVLKNIPKPYFCVQFFEYPGDLVKYNISNDGAGSYISGHDAIYNIFRYKHKRIEEYDALPIGYDQGSNLHYNSERNKIQQLAISEFDVPYFLDPRRELQLKEAFIPDYYEDFINSYQNETFPDKIALTFGIADLPKEHLYDFDVYEVPKAMADAFSVIPVVGVLGDIAGFAISSYEGNHLDAAIYGGGALLSVVGLGAAKFAVKTGVKSSTDVLLIAAGRRKTLSITSSTIDEQIDAVAAFCGLSKADAGIIARRVNNDPEIGKKLYNKHVYDEIARLGDDAAKVKYLDDILKVSNSFLQKFNALSKYLRGKKIFSAGGSNAKALAEIDDVSQIVRLQDEGLNTLTDVVDDITPIATVPDVRFSYRVGDDIVEEQGDLVLAATGKGDEVCIAGKHLCFAPETEVWNGDRFNSIEALFKLNPERIKKTFSNKLVKVWSNGQVLLSCTPNHPILVYEKGWIPASQIKPNDFLVSKTNQKIALYSARSDIPVDSVEIIDTLAFVYSFIDGESNEIVVGPEKIIALDDCWFTKVKNKIGEDELRALQSALANAGITVRDRLKLYKIIDNLDDDIAKKLAIDLKDEDFARWLNGGGDIEAWKVARNLDPKIGLNPSVLGKIDDILSDGVIPQVKFEAALNQQLERSLTQEIIFRQTKF